jgi:dihydrofolate synthase/folylpolyglutamate synthase
VRFNERIRVDGKEIPNEDVMRIYGLLQPHMKRMAAASIVNHPTFFEATTAMAFQYFAERKVDIAVIEVGMGGRYDATNVVLPEVSVLTRIGLEHTEHLGRTVRRIAREKSGIIKEGRPAVTVEQEALAEVEARAAETRSPLTVIGRDVRFECLSRSLEGQRVRVSNSEPIEVDIPLLGAFQAENAAVAIAVVEALRRRGWKIPEEALREGLRTTRWPARLQVVRREPLVLVDSAHNPPAVAALAGAFRDWFPGRTAVLVTGVMADKDLDPMAATLLPLVSEVMAVKARVERALDPAKVGEAFTRAAVRAGQAPPKVRVAATPAEGVRLAMESAAREGTVLVAGSVYVAGEVLEALGAG